MKRTFTNYTNELDKIFKNYRGRVNDLTADVEAKRAENRAAQANHTFTRERKAVSAQDLAAHEKEYAQSVDSAYREATASVAALRNELEADTAEYLAPKTDAVDMRAVALLNSGALSDADLVSLARE